MSETLPEGLSLVSHLNVDDQSCFIYTSQTLQTSQNFLVDGSFPWSEVVEDVLAGHGLDEPAAEMGRGAIFFLSGGKLPYPIVVRQYRHGGLLRFLSGARFFSPHRFISELKLHTQVQRLGIAVPQALGVIVVKPGAKSIFVNGYYVTRRLQKSVGLAEYLESVGAANRLQISYDIGAGLRKLHEHGIFYTDLHVKNILVGPQGEICFIDFDKAKQEKAPLPGSRRRANLYRFIRSIEKYCCRGGKLTDRDRAAFLIAYELDPKKYEKLFRQLGFGLFWRYCFYRLGWRLNRS
ncbi:MAG: lipopolysaccharide kinase InaA family protein [Pseudomonadota bacterium]|nr:lipopolysaccharide kinase InaA family protein [Pseudomonadota bacterium]